MIKAFGSYQSVAEGRQLDLTCVRSYGYELETLVLQLNATSTKLLKAQCGYARANIYLLKVVIVISEKGVEYVQM